MTGFLNYLKDLVNANATASSMRFIFLLSYLFIVITVFYVWASISIVKCEMINIPVGVTYLVVGILALITTGKVVQSFWDSGSSTTTTTDNKTK